LLGVLSIVGGWIGIGNRFEHFLDPVIQKVSVEQSSARLDEAAAMPPGEGEAAGESKGLEIDLMAVSVIVAFCGLALAWFLYVKRPELPAKIAASSGGLYRLLLNKYWIDELYAAVIIGPLVALSRIVLWQSVDQKAIDGSINECAVAARDVSQVVRQQQSGLIRSYAGWVAVGAAAVVAYMVWMGTR
jgi:NADH-quinone oxidoreductase subunit L